MPDKPTAAVGYGPEFLEGARRTCLHVATVVGDMTYRDRLVPVLSRMQARRQRTLEGLGFDDGAAGACFTEGS